MHPRIAPDVDNKLCLLPTVFTGLYIKSCLSIYLLNLSFSACSVKAVLTFYVCTYKSVSGDVTRQVLVWPWVALCICALEKMDFQTSKPQRIIAQKTWGKRKQAVDRQAPSHSHKLLPSRQRATVMSERLPSTDLWGTVGGNFCWFKLKDFKRFSFGIFFTSFFALLPSVYRK